MLVCEFGVARAGGGDATVVVSRPDGTIRAIFFRMGRPVGADTSEADGYPEFRAEKKSDLNFIRIGGGSGWVTYHAWLERSPRDFSRGLHVW